MKKKQQSVTPVSTKIAAFSMLAIVALGLIYFLSVAFGNKTTLPVLGERGHVAGAFSFVNQDGESITEKSVRNRVTVVEYFFTSCPSICPVMNANLKEVYEKFKTNPAFMILSHTVDPERDSVTVLKKYAARYDAESPGWQFLTGSKDSLYQRASKDYLLAVEDSSNSSFIHTQYVALLDKKRQIRGFYDLTNKENVGKMTEGIQQLLKEDDQ
ncbi:MAG TPA: SCO family protein [Puia sp.]|nr:SCO family protein [Puia sp.]